MSFKQAKPIKGTNFLDSDIVYIWDDTNPNDVVFKKVIKDYQAEINNYNGCDLKSLVSKNIMPTTDKSPMYVDETIYKDIDVSKLYELSQLDVYVDDETGELIKEDMKDENKTTEPINKPSSEFGNETESLLREKK